MSIRRTALGAVALLTLAACGTDAAAPNGGATESASVTSSASADPTSTDEPTLSCVAQTAAELSPQQKAAQLVLVGMTTSTIGTATTQIADGYASGVFLLSGWPSTDTAASAAEQVHQLREVTAGIDTWVAIDQEGGQVQQLKGPDASVIPSALQQGQMDPAELQSEAAVWAGELAEAGADINLAPVADVVPTQIGKQNAPIGLYDRQFGSEPQAVTDSVIAFMQGMQDGGVLPTVKHFPGIGRILGNTDQTAVGISDQVMTADDELLQPFQAAIDAGAPIVMISTAKFPNIDPDNVAAFSTAVIDDLLRDSMGFEGVVISDDLGVAKSVADVPVDERITRFIGAGGDVVLTAQPSQAATMNDAVVSLYDEDPQFADKVDAAVERVLTLKDANGQLPCSS